MAAVSGQITVTTAGTEVQGPNVSISSAAESSRGGGVMVRALAGNTGKVYVGNDGSNAISSTTGYELSPGDQVFLDVANLNELWFDAATSGDKFCWLVV